MQEFKVDAISVGQRADVFVASHYPQFTRSALKALFDQGLVTLNGQAAKASHKIRLDEKLAVDEYLLKLEPPAIELPIIYEDDNVIVIDKPSGVLTHSKGALNLEGTVASFIKDKIKDPSLTTNRAGIVHRLDRGTSGVIITAKTSAAMAKLQAQFSKRKSKKTYLAVVEGVLDPPAATIDVPIERNPKKPQTFRVGTGGKAAQTNYQTLKIISKAGKNYSLVELKPLTGRTHQLRVHLAYIGHPVVGDNLYGHSDGPLMLHAASLEITLPTSERKTFDAVPPKTFKDFIDAA